MQSFSDCRSNSSKEPQWTNDCGSFLPCFLLLHEPLALIAHIGIFIFIRIATTPHHTDCFFGYRDKRHSNRVECGVIRVGQPHRTHIITSVYLVCSSGPDGLWRARTGCRSGGRLAHRHGIAIASAAARTMIIAAGGSPCNLRSPTRKQL